MKFRLDRRLLAGAFSLLACAAAPAQAEDIKVGLSKLLSYPAVPIAIDRGYFKEQGLDAQMIFFDSAQPVAVAVASGGVNFGVAGLSAGFYALAAQGELRLLGASAGEEPGFYNLVFLASNKAYAAGLTAAKDLPGHDVAVTQIGTSLHYSIGLLAEKDGFPLKSVTVKPLQSNSNVISALTGGTIAAGVMPVTPALPLLQKGAIKLLGWVGDLVPGWTGSATFTSTWETNNRSDVVKRYMTAYRKGAHDYHDAFTTADGKRKDGPGAPAMLAFLSRFTGIPADDIDRAIPYVDAQGGIDPQDIAHQLDWYRSQGMLKPPADANEIVDKRFAVPPTKIGSNQGG